MNLKLYALISFSLCPENLILPTPVHYIIFCGQCLARHRMGVNIMIFVIRKDKNFSIMHHAMMMCKATEE
jgi:hypothetical protein